MICRKKRFYYQERGDFMFEMDYGILEELIIEQGILACMTYDEERAGNRGSY